MSRRRPATRMIAALAAGTQLLWPLSSYANLQIAQQPLYTGGELPPMVMLNITKDHQLHMKAFNDYSDLDGDGTPETTYKHSFDYYGYFDSNKCYKYESGVFVPNTITSDKYCESGKGLWSGNFLNWASMTRIDAIRKLLYGGMRSADTSSRTVLERAFLPGDSHSFAKYYNGDDVEKLTPFKVPSVAPTATSSETRKLDSSKNRAWEIGSSNVGKFRVGDQVRVQANSNAGTYLLGYVSNVGSSTVTVVGDRNGEIFGNTGTDYQGWTLTNLTDTGLTICNTTPGSSSGAAEASHTNANAPLLMIAKGNYSLWATNEKWQCKWDQGSNENRVGQTGLPASRGIPNSSSLRLNATGVTDGQYIARVEACKDGLLGSEKCKQYPSKNHKPVGLLQTYGDKGMMNFGLMTGSYDKNISGGVLRRNVSEFKNELNVDSDGSFRSNVQGLVHNLNKLRVYGYSYKDGTYSNYDRCTYQQTGLVTSGGNSNTQGRPANEGDCSSWGNPMGESFLETLRYFAGKQPTAAFSARGNGKDGALGLTSESWIDPINAANYCSSLNTIVFNAATSSYDNDQLGGLFDLGASKTAQQLTNEIGDAEGINGKNWFVGGVGSLVDGLCTSKTVSGLGEILGICPEEPSQKGTFNIAGIAWQAHDKRIRKDFAVKQGDERSLKVDTYGVQLASSTPRIHVKVGGKDVTIIPAYRLDYGNKGTGTLVDFKIIEQTPTKGSYFINWEDSNQGGDFDMDVWGVLKYEVVNGQLNVTTDVLGAATGNPQGFGYTISGTNKDGVHFQAGFGGFNYTDPTGAKGCSNCQVNDAPVTETYTVTGNAGGHLPDPLMLAAKWGGFKDIDGDGKPLNVNEWDKTLADGSPGSDGLPDNYFFVQNPRALEAALERAFVQILATASSSGVAANSTSITTNSHIYQARFVSNDWRGELRALPISDQGQVSPVGSWEAGAQLNARKPDSRNILSYDQAERLGIPFLWDSLSPLQKGYLNRNTGAGDARGKERLDWLRGERSKEGNSLGNLRQRSSRLGDIVNSSPAYVAAPASGYTSPSYLTFRNEQKNRKPVIYVGANDGMLHAFDAANGEELFAYVPGVVLPELYRLTEQVYPHRYYVDGTPEVRDVEVNGKWRTWLAGGLRAGGQGVYALDVTDPTAVNASSVKWEFTDKDDADLGFTFGQPKLVQMANGKWAAIFGNGYNNTDSGGTISDKDDAVSSSGKAGLFIAWLEGPGSDKVWNKGTDYLKLEVPVGSTGEANGIADVFPADLNSDGKVDAVYAGDLAGNLWRFDVDAKDPASWKLGNNGKPIFTAPKVTDPASGQLVQPSITSDLEITRNPNGGYMAFFGTGRYLQTADPRDKSLQTFWAIQDLKNDLGNTVAQSQLVKQEILEEKASGSNVWRRTSNNPVDYAGAGAKRGWYMPLQVKNRASQGERVVYAPLLAGGRIIFPTMIPSESPCDRGGDGWLMELNALSGTPLSTSPFDVNGDLYFNGNDQLNWSDGSSSYVSGRKSTVGMTPTPTIIRGNENTQGSPKEFKITSGTSGLVESIAESMGAKSGRLSWREILK